MISNYSDIQNRIDNLYNTKWLQVNAFYPTLFFYTDKSVSDKDYTIDQFLKIHVNQGPVKANLKVKVKDKMVDRESSLTKLKDIPTTMKDYINLEEKLDTNGIVASESVLRQFVKIKDLKNYNVPLTKDQHTLTNEKEKSNNNILTLEFLSDRDFHVLRYLQAWQSRWYTYDFQKKSLASKSIDTEKENDNGKAGGEGYLGLSNCVIDINGNIEVISHLSVFGLIPKQINLPTEFGPQASAIDIKKISVSCLYSQAILTYPDQDRLGFYYFS